MKTKIHKITWEARWNKSKSDILIEITDTDCMVTAVNNPCARWAIGEYWYIVCKWFQKKGATVILGEEIENKLIPIKNEDQYHFDAKNPKRLPDEEWLDRQR